MVGRIVRVHLFIRSLVNVRATLKIRCELLVKSDYTVISRENSLRRTMATVRLFKRTEREPHLYGNL